MAGGQGTRLHPLTRDRAKPAVPFGGKYRIIDFVLSNLVNSGIYAIYVLVQWRSQSLIEHLKDGWQFGGMLPDHFVIPVPAQMRMGELWYQGTADAIFQNLNLIDDTKPDLVAVFGADHIYRMDIQQMIEFHMERKAAVTVATLPVSVDEADQFGIVQVDSGLRVSGFVEKPSNPPQMPGAPGRSLASMGNYLFSPEVLREAHAAGFKGAMIHGLTHGSFTDEKRFWCIYERAAALDVPIYIHPAAPHRAVVDAYFKGYPTMEGAGLGFTFETAAHAIRLSICGQTVISKKSIN